MVTNRNGPSKEGTSHVSSELILSFLESGKKREKIGYGFRIKLLFFMFSPTAHII